MSSCDPCALVSTAGWYVGKAADFTGSSYTATARGLKCSGTMNRAAAECSSVDGYRAGLTVFYPMSTYPGKGTINEFRGTKILNLKTFV